MPALTPEMAGNSLIVLGISYIVVFAFQVYMLYLNWKQSKVEGKMGELIEEVKKISKMMERKK